MLKRAATKLNISFPLLSDYGSKTIDAYGIRNKEAAGRSAGIPHPMTFLLDEGGVVRAKLGHEGYRDRHTSAELIDAAAALK